MKCTAHKTDGTPCNAHAIKGKDVCRVHGGMTPIKHGLYSKYKDLYAPKTQELAEDPDLVDMRYPIAEIAGLAAHLRERIEDTGIIGQAEREAMLTLSVELTKAIKRYQDTQGVNVNVKGEVNVDGCELYQKLSAIAERRRIAADAREVDSRREGVPRP